MQHTQQQPVLLKNVPFISSSGAGDEAGKEALGAGTACTAVRCWWHCRGCHPALVAQGCGRTGPVGQRHTVMLGGHTQTLISLYICSRAPLVAFILI